MDKTHARHADTLVASAKVQGIRGSTRSTHPQNHNDGNEDTRAPALEQDIGERLENRVRDEEDSQGDVILGIGDV